MTDGVVVDEDPSGEYILCECCGQHVLPGDTHQALCGLPCAAGREGALLYSEPVHNGSCPRCAPTTDGD